MWIPSKLTRPRLQQNTIIRSKVLERLASACGYKMVLFQSPAGYGKTTMAAQWLVAQHHVGWYTLDETDNDTFHFINYFLEVINKATAKRFPNATNIAKRRQFSSLTSLLSELFTELSQLEQHCYIVLDDYHLIVNEEIHEAVRFFLKHIPDNLTLVVTSRSTPPLGVANLRVRNLMLEIGNDLLAFDTEETQQFFNQRVVDSVDGNTASNLRNYVEGWPSALQLIALQAQKQPLAQLILPTSSTQSFNFPENGEISSNDPSLAPLNHAHLWDYLAEEVFELLDQETRHFLMQCSVLACFNDQLINHLTHRDDALNMIETLNRFGLFIYPLEGEHHWYRFHHLFAEFLSHERQARIPQQEQDLHYQAAHAWLKQNNPNQALYHAQKSNNGQLLATILNDYGWKMFNQGALCELESAIIQLNDDELFTRPKLSLLQAWLAQSQHRFEEVGELLSKAQQQHTQRNIVINAKDEGQFNALRAQVAINKNQPELALELAELALSQLDDDFYRSRIVATSVVGEVNHVLGNLSRALSMMQQTEKLARQYQEYHQTLWAILQQSEILIAQGFVQAAYQIQDIGFKFIEEHQLQQVPLHEFLLRIRAQILWCWHHLDEAQECAYKGLEVLASHSPSKHLHSYSMLARIATQRGEWDKASHFIEQILYLLKQSNYHLDWTANASLSLLLYWQEKRNVDAIKQWLDNAIFPEKANNHFLQLQWRNIARAQLNLQQYQAAQTTLAFLQKQAQHYGLVTDISRNTILETVIEARLNNVEEAQQKLAQALKIAHQTDGIGNFFIDGKIIYPLLEQLLTQHATKLAAKEETNRSKKNTSQEARGNLLSDTEYNRATQLQKMLASVQQQHVHFDENVVERLINNPNTPELIRTSPLTQREWQVLGLIYSGLSNDLISQELDVAPTTIKTHIRNLYQKLNITNRKEAITTAEKLLTLIETEYA